VTGKKADQPVFTTQGGHLLRLPQLAARSVPARPNPRQASVPGSAFTTLGTRLLH
jgi:hypothetical protein